MSQPSFPPTGVPGGGLTDLSREEAFVLSRYCIARLVLARLKLVTIAKYVALVLVLGLFVPNNVWLRALAIALLVVIALVALAQSILRAAMRRFGRFDQLGAFDDLASDIAGRFRGELVNIGIRPSPLRMLRIASKVARGTATAQDAMMTLFGVEWQHLFSASQIIQARRELAVAVHGRPPGPDPSPQVQPSASPNPPGSPTGWGSPDRPDGAGSQSDSSSIVPPAGSPPSWPDGGSAAAT